MEHQSMIGYFDHIGDKIYIDRYPKTIISLDDLTSGSILEIGCGVGNDAKFLLDNGIDPSRMFLIESDIWYYVDLVDRLEERLGENIHSNVFYGDMKRIPITDEFVDFVYANNVLHCLPYNTMEEEAFARAYRFSLKVGMVSDEQREFLREFAVIKPQDKLKSLLREIYRVLKEGGVFFGRTLSREIDFDKLHFLEKKPNKSEEESFVLNTTWALQQGELLGISPLDLGKSIKDVGFRNFYSENKPGGWKPVTDFYFRIKK